MGAPQRKKPSKPASKIAATSPQAAARTAFRDEVRRAAERVFGEKGFAAAKMADIAAEAGVGVGTLYNYFANKEEIFTEIFISRTGDFEALLERATEGRTPVEQIATIVRTSMAYLEEHGALIAMFFERGGIGELDIERLGGKVVDESYSRFLQRLESVMQAAIDAGELRNDIPVSTMVAALSGARNGALYLWLKSRRRGHLPEVAENLLELFLSGARART